MKKLWLALPVLFASTTLIHGTASAQAKPAAGTALTAVCNDGTNWSGASRQGACSGHKGVKTWGGSAASANSTPASKSATSGATDVKPAGPGAANAASPSPKQQASGAGQKGQVWVNTATNVYHCPGDRFYGKTKDGKFMSEADAKKAGAKPDHGNSCPK